MASATDTGNPEPPQGPARPHARVRMPLAGSRLGRLILLLNLLGLLVLVAGALVFNEFRRGLVEARLDSLNTQGQLISYAIVNAATEGDPEPAPAVQDGAAPLRPTLADPFLPTTSRKQRALPSFKAQARGSQAV